MPKIAFITASVNRGGASKVITLLSNDYVKKGWDVDFLIKDTWINGYPLDDRIKVIEFGKTGENHSIKFLLALRRYLKREMPHRIVSFLTLINLYIIIAHLGLPGTLIISERNDPKYSEPGWQFLLSKFLYRIADKIVFQSQRVKRYYAKGIQEKSQVILNPIEITQEKDPEKETLKIATAGRFVEQKNHRLLMEAFFEIHEKYPDYHLAIYGDGPMRHKYEAWIEQLGISHCVTLPGNVTNLHKCLSDTQIFVISSDYEGLSNALLEAMSMGLVCISTKSGGAEEIITSYVNGILVETGNKQQLVEALLTVINDPKYRKTLSQNAKSFSQRFRKESIIREWNSFIL